MKIQLIRTATGGKKENQDNYCVLDNNGTYLFVVADGVGGSSDGKRAAQIVIDTMIEAWEQFDGSSKSDFLKLAITKANQNIAAELIDNHTLASTVAAILIDYNEAVSAHAGDSRVMQLSAGKLVDNTNDHSLAYAKYLMGEIAKEEVATHPTQTQLINCLKGDEALEIDIKEWDVSKGEQFVVCSDGFWEVFQEKEIQALYQSNEPEKLFDEHMASVLKMRPKQDNTTALLFSSYSKPPQTTKVKQWVLPTLAVTAIAICSFMLGTQFSDHTEELEESEKVINEVQPFVGVNEVSTTLVETNDASEEKNIEQTDAIPREEGVASEVQQNEQIDTESSQEPEKPNTPDASDFNVESATPTTLPSLESKPKQAFVFDETEHKHQLSPLSNTDIIPENKARDDGVISYKGRNIEKQEGEAPLLTIANYLKNVEFLPEGSSLRKPIIRKAGNREVIQSVQAIDGIPVYGSSVQLIDMGKTIKIREAKLLKKNVDTKTTKSPKNCLDAFVSENKGITQSTNKTISRFIDANDAIVFYQLFVKDNTTEKEVHLSSEDCAAIRIISRHQQG